MIICEATNGQDSFKRYTMDWLNIFGLIFIVIIMIPNIIYAIKCKDGFANKWQNKTVEL